MSLLQRAFRAINPMQGWILDLLAKARVLGPRQISRTVTERLAKRRQREATDRELAAPPDEGLGEHGPHGDPSEAVKPAVRQEAANPDQEVPRVLNLALQGGGAHGAFTWGVLDRLLEDERITIEGVSGASAGAVNAALLASGWLQGGRAGARETLAAFWRRLPALALPEPLQVAFGLLTEALSPYQLNPLGLDPLRGLLAELVDFEAIRAAAEPRLFVAATHVRTGEGRIFRNRELSVEAVLASACLPRLQQAVEIDGEAYWDGGFTSNPPLLPLVEHCRARDLLLIQLDPSEVAELPVTAPEIRQRLGQVVFNAPLRQELRALEMAARLARDGLGRGDDLRRRLASLRLHRIDATPAVGPLGAASAGRPDRDLLLHLRERGRAAADAWLAELARPAAALARAA